jgi:hypothetical protein
VAGDVKPASDFYRKYFFYVRYEILLDTGRCAANLRLMASRRIPKGGQPSAVAVAPDRLEIHGPLAAQLRAAAKQLSATLGRRVTPQQYASAVLKHALTQACIGHQVPIPYLRE